MRRPKSGGEDRTDDPKDIVRRLDALIALLVEWQPSEGLRRGSEDQTIRLRKAGLRPFEIANITGRALSNVTKNIAQARKDGRIPKGVK